MLYRLKTVFQNCVIVHGPMFRAILIKYFWVQGQGRGDQRRGAEDAQRAHQGEWGGNKAIRKNRFVQSKQSDAWNNISKFLSKLKVLNYLWYGR